MSTAAVLEKIKSLDEVSQEMFSEVVKLVTGHQSSGNGGIGRAILSHAASSESLHALEDGTKAPH